MTENSGDRVIVLRQLAINEADVDTTHGEKTRRASIVLRGTTTNARDDLECAVADGVNALKALLRDPRLVLSEFDKSAGPDSQLTQAKLAATLGGHAQ